MQSKPDQKTEETLELCRNSLAAFGAAVEPGYQTPPHVAVLIRKLEAVEAGRTRRLLVFMPPRHGKSLTVSTAFACWFLGRHPNEFIVIASHSQELASVFGRRARNIVASEIFRAIFPQARLSDDSSAIDRFDLTAGGGGIFVGVGSSLTGRGCSLLVLDDLIKDRLSADSPAIRKSTEAWYREVARTRLEPGGRIVGVGTRWHSLDIFGVLASDENERFESIRFPAIAERNEGFRREGEALWPARFSVEDLQSIRSQIGTRAWNALYQAAPLEDGGGIFRPEWFQHYDQRPAEFTRIIQAWDCAFGKSTQGDFSACVTIGETKTGFYVLHVFKDRPDFPTLKRKMGELAAEWKASAVLVEDAASGQSAIQALRAESRLPLLPVKVTADKVSRWNAVSPLLEAGKVLFPSGAPWLADLEDELASAPASAHDDVTDALAHALTYLRGGGGYFEYLRKRHEERAAAAAGPKKATGPECWCPKPAPPHYMSCAVRRAQETAEHDVEPAKLT